MGRGEGGEVAAAAVLQRVSEEKIIEQKILFDRFTLLDPRLQLLLLIQLKCVCVCVQWAFTINMCVYERDPEHSTLHRLYDK